MKRIAFEALVELVGGDREFVTTVVRHEIVVESEGGFALRDVDRVLAAQTLVRELDIDWSAIGLILQLRQQLAEARSELEKFRSVAAAPKKSTES